MAYDVIYSGPGLGQAQRCGGIKPVNGIPTLLTMERKCLFILYVIKMNIRSTIWTIKKKL